MPKREALPTSNIPGSNIGIKPIQALCRSGQIPEGARIFFQELLGCIQSITQNHGKAKFIPKPKKFIDKNLPSTTIHQVENSKGYVELKMDPAIRKMARELTKMNQSLGPHLAQAIDAAREVTFHMEKTADAFNKLGSATASLHSTYKSVADKFDFEVLSRVESIYAEISRTFSSFSKITRDEKDNFNQNIENFFNYCTCEVEGMEDLLTLRNEFSIEYKEKRQLLDAKKETVYPTMDLKKWEIDQDNLPISKTQLISDKSTALRYMFPKVSKIKVRKLKMSKI